MIPRIILLGDVGVAASHVGLAKKLARQTAAAGTISAVWRGPGAKISIKNILPSFQVNDMIPQNVLSTIWIRGDTTAIQTGPCVEGTLWQEGLWYDELYETWTRRRDVFVDKSSPDYKEEDFRFYAGDTISFVLNLDNFLECFPGGPPFPGIYFSFWGAFDMSAPELVDVVTLIFNGCDSIVKENDNWVFLYDIGTIIDIVYTNTGKTVSYLALDSIYGGGVEGCGSLLFSWMWFTIIDVRVCKFSASTLELTKSPLITEVALLGN